MADFNITPIGNTVKPVPGMSLSDMMNMASSAQAYQQQRQLNPLQLQAAEQTVEQARRMNPLALQAQQQQTRTGQIALGLEEQKNTERLAAQDYFSKPDNFLTNGNIDLKKINKVSNLFPLTFPDINQKYTTLADAQTKASSAKQNLTQDQRSIIGSRFAILGRLGVEDKQAYLAEMDVLNKENPDNPDFANLIDAYKTIWKDIPSGKHVPSLAISGAQSLLKPAEQQSAFAPTAGTLNTGANILPTVATPGVGGQPPSIQVGQQPLAPVEVGPSSRMVGTGRFDMNNNEIFNVFKLSGRVIGQTTVPSGVPEAQMPGVGAAPSGTPAANATAAAARAAAAAKAGAAPRPLPNAPVLLPAGETRETLDKSNAIRMNSNEAAAQVPNQYFNSNEIIKLADNVISGIGAQTIANLTGGYAVFNATRFGRDNATNLQQLGHYMALQTASLANSSGLGGTDAARSLAGQMAGTTEWTPEAIKDTARVNRALSTSGSLFNQGIEAAFERSNQNPFSSRKFQNDWSKTLGPNGIDAIRLYDLTINQDMDGVRKFITSLGGTESARYKTTLAKITEMNNLLRGTK
jgi:hypothetical protein